MREWVLRDQILVATHRWPVIAVFFLAGSLLGWGVSLLWPAPYRAAAEISVSLDAYRSEDDQYVAAYANTEFRNPDDYKHWQMSQLSVLAASDEYLQETLDRLKSQDPAWENTDVPALRNRLQVYWRNAGRWRLVAETEDPRHSVQAVETWREVILEKTSQAVANSQRIFLLDLKLQVIAAEQLQIQGQVERLPESLSALDRMREQVLQAPEKPLEAAGRWRLSALAAGAAGLDPAWQALLEEMPPSGAAAQDYLPWIERLEAAIEQRRETLQSQQRTLEEEQARVKEEWESALQSGRGLSATLMVGAPNSASPQASRVRPASLAALVGGLLGFTAWGLVFLGMIAQGKRT